MSVRRRAATTSAQTRCGAKGEKIDCMKTNS
jgi:hypothetical protein